MRRRLLGIALALALCGCGVTATGPLPASTVSVDIAAAPDPALSVALSSPVAVTRGAASYTTQSREPIFRGTVTPADASVYVRSAGGPLVVVIPNAQGSFAVRTVLAPGANRFQLIAARLGSRPRVIRLGVTWRGRAAASAEAQTAHAQPQGGSAPGQTAAAGATGVTVSTISAPPAPATGGDGRWLGGFELTQYYPAPESWFGGRLVAAPGLSGRYPIDWLYSARGLSMEGEGIADDGRWVHIDGLGAGGWLTAAGGRRAIFGGGADAPYWRTGGFWRTASRTVTYPLAAGGWSAGPGVRYVPPPSGISFAPGPARPLGYLRSIAVDPKVIPLGSDVYIPAYAQVNGGWFEAQDTGGAILGRHIDVFVPPPSDPSDLGSFATGQRVYIVAPGGALP